MRKKENRLNSFQVNGKPIWSLNHPPPMLLADAGFFYIGKLYNYNPKENKVHYYMLRIKITLLSIAGSITHFCCYCWYIRGYCTLLDITY